MSIQNETKSGQSPTETHIPRKMTFAENAFMTIKLLAGFVLLGAAIWMVERWTGVR